MHAPGFSRHPSKIAGEFTQLVMEGVSPQARAFMWSTVRQREKPEWRGNLTKYKG
jgi:hypothetical protein